MRAQHPKSEQGFALIIVAGLFIAFAMIAAVMIDRANATKQQGLIDRTQTQLSRLSNALLRYSLDHSNKYPCPANPYLAISNAAFGAAIASCEADPVNANLTALNADILRGMVPVTELLIYGATPNDAFDAWGNRIMYVIDRRMTPNGSGTPSSPRANITDTTTGTTATYRSPDYILISYGRDGVGAIPKNATSVAIACTASGEMRSENCNNDLNFFVRPITTGPGLTSAQYFDDILVFYGR